MLIESIQSWLASDWSASELASANEKPPRVRSKKIANGSIPNGVGSELNGHAVHAHSNCSATAPARQSNDDNDNVPIAVVGMSFRFPQGLESAESFWEALAEGRSAWSTFPKSRINFDGVYDADQERLNGVGYILDLEISMVDIVTTNEQSPSILVSAERSPFRRRRRGCFRCALLHHCAW